MADYDLICRERTEDELTCSCKTKCGVFSDVQVMKDGSGARILTVYAGDGFSNPAPHEYIRCPCGLSIGKAIVQGFNNGVFPTKMSFHQKVSIVTAEGRALSKKEVGKLFPAAKPNPPAAAQEPPAAQEPADSDSESDSAPEVRWDGERMCGGEHEECAECEAIVRTWVELARNGEFWGLQRELDSFL